MVYLSTPREITSGVSKSTVTEVKNSSLVPRQARNPIYFLDKNILLECFYHDQYPPLLYLLVKCYCIWTRFLLPDIQKCRFNDVIWI